MRPPFATFCILHLVVAYFLLVAPWLSRHRVRTVERRIAAGDTAARIRLFRYISRLQWALVGILLCLVSWGGVPARQVGLGPPRSWPACAAVLVILACLFVWSGLRMRAKADRVRSILSKRATVMIPTTEPERVWFGVIALGSGLSEELLCRGFFFYYVALLAPGIALWAIALVTSAAFGFAHLYQGAKGVLLTGAIGLLLALVYIATGSLLIPAVLHSLANLRLVFLKPEALPAAGREPAQSQCL